MKLAIIVFSLLSERYLVHVLSLHRFHWFAAYCAFLRKKAEQYVTVATKSSGFFLLLFLLPLLLLTAAALFVLDTVFYGFFQWFFSLFIFYYCLGPDNMFFPVLESSENPTAIKEYFARVQRQVFAPIFWFLAAGVLGVLTYRVLFLCKEQEKTRDIASVFLDFMDWIPARITLLLYLLAGNFQRGWPYYRKMFFSKPGASTEMLKTGGMLVVEIPEEEVTLPLAARMVECALIIYLVAIAICTLAAWLY